MKIIYTGLESAGKSLKLAMVAHSLVERNQKYFNRTDIKRPIYSNQLFSHEFEVFASIRNVPIIYWKNLTELIGIEDADVIVDEVGNYFDARGWENLSLDVRRWLTQGAKSGVELYGSAQDFAQIDKAFRRLVNELYEVIKVVGSPRPSATRPTSKPWGICWVLALNPREYNEDSKEVLSYFAGPFFIRQFYTDMFNTRQKITKSDPPPLLKEVRVCLEDGFKRVRYY